MIRRLIASGPTSTQDLHRAKSQLRKHMNQLLSALSPEIIETEGKVIEQMLLKSSIYQKSKHIGIYVSFGKELPTRHLIHHILSPGSGKICYVPQIIEPTLTERERLKLLRINDQEDFESLKPNRWGILEPSADQQRTDALETSQLDLLLVPGLAFQLNGARLGRGKGYYDRLIFQIREHFAASGKNVPCMVGLALSAQIVSNIPMGVSDQFLDRVLFSGCDTTSL